MIKKKEEAVVHPSHYNQGGIECFDAMKAAFGLEDFATFCRLNAFKYIWRSKEKGKEIEDVSKAIVYLQEFKKTRELQGKESGFPLLSSVVANLRKKFGRK